MKGRGDAREGKAACPECGELNTHAFRSSDDLVHAVQVAAAEIDRGALERIDVPDRSAHEQAAVGAALAAGAVPDRMSYRFRCTVCGEQFELSADTARGGGSWTRESDRDP